MTSGFFNGSERPGGAGEKDAHDNKEREEREERERP
jgi:hypothetical protein